MTKSKKEITNNDLFQLIEKLDKKVGDSNKEIKSDIQSTNDMVDSLAAMVSKEFVRIDERFDSIDQHLTLHDKRFEDIDQHLTLHDRKLEDIDLRLNEVAHNFELQNLSKKVDALGTRVEKLEFQRE